MTLATTEKDEVKAMVLTELDHMFSELTNKYNTKENHDMMLFLLDIENKIKQALNKVDA